MAQPDFTPDERWTRRVDDTLIVRATEQPNSPLLARFFAGYDRAFVLADEREEIAGFRACLALNPTSRHRFGRIHRELVVTVEEAGSGTLLGGANFLSTRIGNPPAGHPPVAVALNYLFVEAEARGRGLSRILAREVEELAAAAVDSPPGGARPALFIEQNDPLRRTASEIAADTGHAGLDQVDRLAIWDRLGARLVDFPYVQPPLSPTQASDPALALAVLNLPGGAVDPGYLAAHLESFFGISVLKGGDPSAEPTAATQLSSLSAMGRRGEQVALLPMRPAIAALKRRAIPARGLTLRQFARQVLEDDLT